MNHPSSLLTPSFTDLPRTPGRQKIMKDPLGPLGPNPVSRFQIKKSQEKKSVIANLMIFWGQNNDDIAVVTFCYFLAKIQCCHGRFFKKTRKKRLREQSNFHIFRNFQYKYTFNNEPKNAKKWIVTVKYRQKTKNYLNMTNIDKS